MAGSDDSSRPKLGRPRAEPAEVQRRRILDAARRVITAEGYPALSVTGVASDAAVGRATVHHLFGDRERLALAVIDDVLGGLIRDVDAHYAASADLNEDLGALIRREVTWFVEALCSDPAILVCIQLSHWLGREAAAEVSSARERIEVHITSLHQDRTRPFGLERDPSARLIAFCVMAIVEVASGRVVDEGWSLPAATALIAQFVEGGYQKIEEHGGAVIAEFDSAHAPSTRRGAGSRAKRKSTPSAKKSKRE